MTEFDLDAIESELNQGATRTRSKELGLQLVEELRRTVDRLINDEPVHLPRLHLPPSEDADPLT